MEQLHYDHPHQQQINALVALCSALIGRLRATGALDDAEIEALLRQADGFVPDGSEALGLRLLAVVREAHGLAAAEAPPPLDRRRPEG